MRKRERGDKKKGDDTEKEGNEGTGFVIVTFSFLLSISLGVNKRVQDFSLNFL